LEKIRAKGHGLAFTVTNAKGTGGPCPFVGLARETKLNWEKAPRGKVFGQVIWDARGGKKASATNRRKARSSASRDLVGS